MSCLQYGRRRQRASVSPLILLILTLWGMLITVPLRAETLIVDGTERNLAIGA